jgi:hypothetical protein
MFKNQQIASQVKMARNNVSSKPSRVCSESTSYHLALMMVTISVIHRRTGTSCC